MKSITMLSGALLLFFTACQNGSDADKKADSTKPAATVAMAPAKSNNVVLVWHKVADFDKWMKGYEAHDSMRLAAGLHNYVIGRDVNDPGMVLVALKMDDLAKAKAFISAPDLKDVMKKGGVVGEPSVSFINVEWNDTSTNSSTTRLMIMHKVKDYDAWKKVFDEDKPNRMAAGLTDRALGHSFDDKNEVSIVCAVSDLKKAKDFGNSKALKEKMTAGGVVGAPAIHFYTVAKKW